MRTASILGPSLAAWLALAGPALAQPADVLRGSLGDAPSAVGEAELSDQPQTKSSDRDPTVSRQFGAYEDPGGLRGMLEERGFAYSLTYIGEGLGNVSGGVRRGAVYEGRLDLQLDLNLETLAGWTGAGLHANFYAIHGRGLSRDNLSNLFVASGIEALPSERLFELWFEQAFGDTLAVRFGQLAADSEFIVSKTAGLFVNSTFGFPGIAAANLPSGGPGYPFAAPGIRVKVAPTKDTTLLVGVFDGDPAGPQGVGQDSDPQRRNRTGTNFRTQDPALILAEGAWSYGDQSDPASLPGTLKVGAWHHLGRFADERTDALGLSLVDPASTGIARRYRGDDGIYGIVDATLWRVPDTKDQGVSAFVRVAGAPADRNPIGFYVDAGIVAKGLVPGRSDDTFGISVARAEYSSRLRALDRDAILVTGVPGPVRTAETVIEATYQATIVPGFTLQPDVQYVIRPGGGIADPRSPTGRRIRDAAIVGLRTAIRY